MRKIINLCLVLILCFVFNGCGKKMEVLITYDKTIKIERSFLITNNYEGSDIREVDLAFFLVNISEYTTYEFDNHTFEVKWYALEQPDKTYNVSYGYSSRFDMLRFTIYYYYEVDTNDENIMYQYEYYENNEICVIVNSADNEFYAEQIIKW